MVCMVLQVDDVGCPTVELESVEAEIFVGSARREVHIFAEGNLKGLRMESDTWQQMTWRVAAYYLRNWEWLRVNQAAS